jgi:hypothetical protein
MLEYFTFNKIVFIGQIMAVLLIAFLLKGMIGKTFGFVLEKLY